MELGQRLDALKALNLITTDPGRTVNHREGEYVTFVRGAADTDGEYAFVRVALAPGCSTDLHFHLTFAEIFETIAGELSIEHDGTILRLGPGERAEAAIGSRHRFFNASDKPVEFYAIIQPARRFEEMLRVAEGLRDDGLLNAKGLPKSILQLGLMFEMGESYLAGMPLWLQRAIFVPIAAVARLRQVDRGLARYTPSPHAGAAPGAIPIAPAAVGAGGRGEGRHGQGA